MAIGGGTGSMEEIRFSRTFTTGGERSYERLYFEVPEGIEKIECSYSYPRRITEIRAEGVENIEANIADIGLLDEQGKLRGWSGSERNQVYVSLSSATPGYRAGTIRKGRWAAILGVYKVRSTVTIDVVVKLHRKEAVLLAGDIHMHTTNSDGSYPTEKVIEFARRTRLDFIALTDHNNTAQNLEVGRVDDLVVICGMEYTNYRGHANFLFPGERVVFDEDPFSSTFEEMRAVFLKAKERGALISLNHFICDNCPWEFGFERIPYDMVEVWNGPMKQSELNAIAWWHDQLASGRRLPAVGGSDTHRYDPLRSYGMPTTFVSAASRSREDILLALSEGKSFITYTRNGPMLDLSIGGTGIGGTVKAARGLEGRAMVREARSGDLLWILDGLGGRSEHRIPFAGEFSVPFPVAPEAKFYRLELRRELLAGLPMLSALSNPVFVER